MTKKQTKKGRIKAQFVAIIGIFAAINLVIAGIAGSILTTNYLHSHTPVITAPPQTVTMLTRINQVRAKAGKSPLLEDPRLDTAASQKTSDQIVRNYWEHTPPTGESPYTFTQQQFSSRGYTSAGENIAKCFKSDDELVEAWVNSPKHYQTMINDFDAMGYAAQTNPRDGNCYYGVMEFVKYR